MRNSKIKLSDSARDNFFRSANCGFGFDDNELFTNIHIRGEGLCVLEGADHPRATGDGTKVLANPCPKTVEDLKKYADWIPEETRKTGKDWSFWYEHSHSLGTDAGKEGGERVRRLARGRDTLRHGRPLLDRGVEDSRLARLGNLMRGLYKRQD